MFSICFGNIHLNALNTIIYDLNFTMSMKLRSCILLNKTIDDDLQSAKVITFRALFFVKQPHLEQYV